MNSVGLCCYFCVLSTVFLMMVTVADAAINVECPRNINVDRNVTGPVRIVCSVIFDDEFVANASKLSIRYKDTNMARSLVASSSESNTDRLLTPADPSDDDARLTFAVTSSSSTPNVIVAELTISDFDAKTDYRSYEFTAKSKSGSTSVSATVQVQAPKPKRNLTFEWWDYVIFFASLAVYAAFGVYYTCVKWQRTPPGGDYILGDRQTNWFNSTWSLYGTFLSALPVLFGASEIYGYGTQYFTTILAFPLSCWLSINVMLPVFYKLKLTSVHEYLEMRYSKAVRVACSFIFIFQMVVYMTLVIYVPSMALQEVIGLNFWVFAVPACVCCIFYTSIAGLAANNWIDVIQGLGMFAGMITVLAYGAHIEGGMTAAIEKVRSQGRTTLWEINPDPRYRNSFWTTTIGMAITYTYTYGVAQTQVEVGLMSATLKDAKISGWLNCLLNMLLVLIPGLIGLLASAHYADCDPVSSGQLDRSEQILVYYVMDVVARDAPGLAGFFVASLCCCALSGLSCGLTALVATTTRDFGIHAYLKKQKQYSANRMGHVTKVISAAYMILCLLMVIPIENAPTTLELVNTMLGALGGPVLGVFLCGLFFPYTNDVGVFIGLLVSIALTVWNGTGANTDPAVSAGQPMPALSTLGCDWPAGNASSPSPSYTPIKQADFSQWTPLESFYALSYLYLSIFGIVIVVVVAFLVTAATSMCQGRMYRCEDSRLMHSSIVRLMRLTANNNPGVIPRSATYPPFTGVFTVQMYKQRRPRVNKDSVASQKPADKKQPS